METTATMTTKEAAAAGGVVGAALGMTMAFMVVLYIMTVIATWKIFKKADEPGWKALIPFYNVYMMYKIVGMKHWFWILMGISILMSVTLSLDGTSEVLYNGTAEQIAAVDWSKHIPSIIALIVGGAAAIYGEALYSWRTSKVFGHGLGFCIGLILLQPIFWLILGFGDSKYNKKLAEKKKI